MSSVHVATALNPYTKEWVTFPQPVLVDSGHLTCFKAENIRRFAQQWNAGHPNDPVDVPDGAKGCPTCWPHFADLEPTALRHVVLGIAYRRTTYVYPFDVELVASCACGQADAWNQAIPGDQLSAWLRRHGAND